MWANYTDRPKRLIHRQRNIAERRVVNRAVELVRPRCVGKDAFDTKRHFSSGLSFSNHGGQTARNLLPARRKIFCHVVQNLRASVGCALGPGGSFVCRLDGITNIFAIAQRCLAQKPSVSASRFHAVARVGTRLFAADVELHRAVDCRCRRIGVVGRFLIQIRPSCLFQSRQCRSILEPGRLKIFKQAFPAALAAIAAFAVAAKSAGGVEQIRAVDPDNSSFELRGDVQGHVDTLAPDASRQSIDCVVRQLDCLTGRAECHRGQHRAENFLLRDDRRGMDVAEQRWRIVEAARR